MLCLSQSGQTQRRFGFDQLHRCDAGGGSGEVIELGDSSWSHLYLLITHEEEPNMPPDSPKSRENMLSKLRDWIHRGTLENSASKANMARKPGKTFAATAVEEQPAEVTFPGRLSLEPLVHTAQRNAVTGIATSPWTPLAAIGGQCQVLPFRAGPIEPVGVLPFPEGEIHVLKLSQDGLLLLAGGGPGAATGGGFWCETCAAANKSSTFGINSIRY